MFPDQGPLFQTIQLRLARSASWRRELADRYGDPRNLRAAQRLDVLASADTGSISDDTQRILAANADRPTFLDAISAAARDVEFRRRPTDIDAFLNNVVEKIARPSVH